MDTARCFLEHLERNWPLHLRVARSAGVEQFMVTDVHDMELIASEADAVGARGKKMTLNLKGDFGQQTGLVLFLHGGRVAGGIDEVLSRYIPSEKRMPAALRAWVVADFPRKKTEFGRILAASVA